MNKLKIPEGHEILCELIRVYPTSEQWSTLRQLQDEVRMVWNHGVRGRQDVARARLAYAKRARLLPEGLNEPTPIPRPELPTPTTEEEKLAVKQAWRNYKHAVKAQGPAWGKYFEAIRKALPDLPELSWRKDSYQDYRKIYRRLGNAVLYRDTVKRLSSTKGAQSKGPQDRIPLVWGNADLVKTGAFYGERRGTPWYNALVSVNGMKLLGRLRRPLPGTQVQGVTLTLKADGWYAAVKTIRPTRVLPEPQLDAIGVDVGQKDIVATVDCNNSSMRETNPRTETERQVMSARQSIADLSKEPRQVATARRQNARLHLKWTRRIRHWIDSELIPMLSQYKTVCIEKLAKNFKSDRGALSCMHIVLDAIKLRLGNRVREVNPAYTSQTCSHCGNTQKEARKGKHYSCVVASCGHEEDADINAARNIMRKGMELQVA